MINDLLFINKNKWDTHNNESTLRYYIYEILIEVPNALNGDSKTTEKIIFDLIEKITTIANKEKLQQNDIDFLDKTQTKIKIILEKIENDIWKEKMGEQWGRVDLEND